MNVAILGASAKADKYAYKALLALVSKGHTVYPVNPHLESIEGQKVYPSLSGITDKIDTLTLYVGKTISGGMIDEIIALNPRRIIFNDGAENDSLYDAAQAKGIDVIYACMLVMLSTDQF